jgi:hypothetical protein
MPKSRLLAFVIKELREVLPPTVFFAVGSNLVVMTTDLILADYLVSFASFIVATIGALVVGKSVLVGRGSLRTRQLRAVLFANVSAGPKT